MKSSTACFAMGRSRNRCACFSSSVRLRSCGGMGAGFSEGGDHILEDGIDRVRNGLMNVNTFGRGTAGNTGSGVVAVAGVGSGEHVAVSVVSGVSGWFFFFASCGFRWCMVMLRRRAFAQELVRGHLVELCEAVKGVTRWSRGAVAGFEAGEAHGIDVDETGDVNRQPALRLPKSHESPAKGYPAGVFHRRGPSWFLGCLSHSVTS